jgi:hypothetical protein
MAADFTITPAAGPNVMANRLGPTSSAWRRNSLPGTPIAAVVRPRRCREAPTIPA